MTDLPWWVIDTATLLLAFIAGLLSGAFSMGGQILMKPGIRVLGASPLEAVGSTVPMILPTVAAATVRYSRDGLVDWSSVRLGVPGGAVGAIVGAVLAPLIPGDGHLLQVATAALMLFAAVRMIADERRAHRGRDERTEDTPDVPVRRGAVVGVTALSGLASGILGVGGGVVMVPGFSKLARMRVRVSVATSLVCAGAFAIPATITHAILGTVNWRFAILLTAGAVPGAHIGAGLSIQSSERHLGLAIGWLMSVVALLYGAGEIAAWINAG